MATLAELGYARTSLREIAQNSEFTHGVVHYYFTDKVELIIHCVRLYKERCVSRFDDLVPGARTAEELLDRFADKLVDTLTTEAPLHRLWYDLRTQSLFEESFRDDVLEMDRTLEDMIWRIVERYAVLSGQRARAGVAGGLRADRRPVRERAARPDRRRRRGSRAPRGAHPLADASHTGGLSPAPFGMLVRMSRQFLLLGQPR